MSAYPSLAPDIGSTIDPIDGRVPVRATNGALKIRQLHPVEKVSITLRHSLGASDRATLESHYSSNKDNAFDFTWPVGGTYSVMYASRPSYEEKSAAWSIATVRLLEV